MRLFGKRKQRPLYVVVVTIYKPGKRYRDFCLVGPMLHGDAVEFATLAEDSIAREWGEALNSMRLSVSCEARQMVSPAEAGAWVRNRLQLLELQYEAVRHGRYGTSDGWDDGDRDGLIQDHSTWERPPLPRHNPQADEENGNAED